MPKLPEIRYSTSVQSLGREDISAPGRLAAAQVGAARSIFEGVKEVERTFAAAEYTKQMSQARNSINELYDAVVSKEAYTSSEIPEFVTGIDRHETVTLPDGTEIVQERIIPASEVREKWFKQGMQNITNGTIKGTKTPTARTRISNELKTSIGPAAYNQLLQYNRTAVKKEQLAILDASVQEGVINGDRLAVEGSLYRFLASGLISKDDYEVRILKASRDLDIEAYSKQIIEAEDDGDLDDVWDDMNSGISPTKPGEEPSDMTPEQRRALRANINAQKSVFDEAKTEERLATEREGTNMLIEGTLSDEWLQEQLRSGNLERPAAMALMNSRDSGTGSTKFVRDSVVSSYQTMYQKKILFPEFGEQASNTVQKEKMILAQNPSVNGKEKAALFDYLDKLEDTLRTTPEYKTAIRDISAIVGVPDMSDDEGMAKAFLFGTSKVALENYNRFSQELWQYVDEFGAEANVREWVRENKDVYSTEKSEEQILTHIKTEYPGVVSTDNYRPDVIMYNAAKELESGNMTEEQVYQLWALTHDTSLVLSEIMP